MPASDDPHVLRREDVQEPPRTLGAGGWIRLMHLDIGVALLVLRGEPRRGFGYAPSRIGFLARTPWNPASRPAGEPDDGAVRRG